MTDIIIWAMQLWVYACMLTKRPAPGRCITKSIKIHPVASTTFWVNRPVKPTGSHDLRAVTWPSQVSSPMWTGIVDSRITHLTANMQFRNNLLTSLIAHTHLHILARDRRRSSEVESCPGWGRPMLIWVIDWLAVLRKVIRWSLVRDGRIKDIWILCMSFNIWFSIEDAK